MTWIVVFVAAWAACGLAVSMFAEVPSGRRRILAVCFGPFAFALSPRYFPPNADPLPGATVFADETIPATTVDVLVADAGKEVRAWLERLPLGRVGVISVAPCSASGDRYMVALDTALDIYTELQDLVDEDQASLVVVESDEPAAAIAHVAGSGGYDIVVTADSRGAIIAAEVGASVLLVARDTPPETMHLRTESVPGKVHLVFAGEAGGPT